MEIEGTPYDWEASKINVRYHPNMSTTDRVVVRVAPSLSRLHDGQVVVNMGWDESTAMAEGDFLAAVMAQLRRVGAENPMYVGVNPSGKGTERYAGGKDVGRIKIADELGDIRTIVRRLLKDGALSAKAKTYIIGHSMGALSSMAMAGQMKTEGAQVAGILNFAPITDEPLGLVRGRFLWACRKHVLPAVIRLVTGEGMPLNHADYNRMMFGGPADLESSLPNFQRGFPTDSGKRFLEATLTIRRMFDEILADFARDGTPVTVIKHGKESIIPAKMPGNHVDYMNSRGVDAKLLTWVSAPHAIPFEMTAVQRAELDSLLCLTLTLASKESFRIKQNEKALLI
ncbi:MAG: hypothetical protein UW03_C0017G0022 [Candidatus Peregrinibacteria bacterium GW2011_GWA2_43_8]|nr:MAG: hypothetical protein UW03_C0017G0022 [Candidatus Peregrinibacteria bacterium GW2011_GWA2_43_8]